MDNVQFWSSSFCKYGYTKTRLVLFCLITLLCSILVYIPSRHLSSRLTAARLLQILHQQAALSACNCSTVFHGQSHIIHQNENVFNKSCECSKLSYFSVNGNKGKTENSRQVGKSDSKYVGGIKKNKTLVTEVHNKSGVNIGVKKPGCNIQQTIYKMRPGKSSSLENPSKDEHKKGQNDKNANWNPLEEIRHLLFAKVHKAASSSLQNIILRFAMSRNLSVMLHMDRTGLNENSDEIPESRLVPPHKGHGKLYDILCNHIIFNEKRLMSYFPSDAVKVAIIREPLRLSVSALKYYFNIYHYRDIAQGVSKHPDDPINAFINNPTDFCYKESMPRATKLNNRMSIDLGAEPHNFASFKRNESKICEFVQKLDRQFDIVLLAEYFDQSMVLLKRLLGWQIKDIIYIRRNTFKSHEASVWSKKPHLTKKNVVSFRRWAAIDYALYDHFFAKFFRSIEKQALFDEEVHFYQNISKKIRNFCMTDYQKQRSFKIPKCKWTEMFIIYPEDCFLMTLEEIEIVPLARNLQLGNEIPHNLTTVFFKSSP